MARKEQGVAAETLEEIEGAADKLSDWLQENFWLVMTGVGGLLLLAGVGAWVGSAQESSEQEASAALAKAREDYLSAMGAPPGSLEVPELANPEAAAQIRAEYEERFSSVAQDFAGTVSGTLAAIESARLTEGEAAQSHLESALADATGPVRGMVLQGLAQRLEEGGDWAGAAARHEEAAGVGDYPLRDWALADAARSWAQAGEPEKALGLYDRLEREAPDLSLPSHQEAQALELRAAASR